MIQKIVKKPTDLTLILKLNIQSVFNKSNNSNNIFMIL